MNKTQKATVYFLFFSMDCLGWPPVHVAVSADESLYTAVSHPVKLFFFFSSPWFLCVGLRDETYSGLSEMKLFGALFKQLAT